MKAHNSIKKGSGHGKLQAKEEGDNGQWTMDNG
jgi:hypothetical protein